MPRKKVAKRAYHHGDLARALVNSAVEILAESGVAELSLRAVARRAEVSHAAPAHHFGDKAGLLTAVAAEGYRRFARALQDAYAAAAPDPVASFFATGRAYVHFAIEHRPFFELMFRPAQLNTDDPDLIAASDAAYQILYDSVVRAQASGFAAGFDPRDVALAAWANVHGLATLWLDGNLKDRVELALDETIDRVLLVGGAKYG